MPIIIKNILADLRTGFSLVSIKVLLNSYKYHFAESVSILSFAKNIKLRQLVIILLLLAFVTQTFSKLFIVGGYYTNTAAYAKNCENKAKPKLHCNGKCQMMKKLKQEENKDKQNPVRKSDNKEEVLSSKSFYATLYFKTVQIKTTYPAAIAAKAVNMPRSFFHPPGA